MFTKQHYDAVASKVKEFLASPDPIRPVDVVTMLTDLFVLDNPKFDGRKFVRACGMSWEEYIQD